MSQLRGYAKRAAATGVQGASRVLGRRRSVRAARFASNALKFDDMNQMAANGEVLIQKIARSQPHPVVFDVGANRGQWSTSLLDQAGHPVELHVFEPSSFSHALAAEAVGDRGRVHALALSEEPGEAQLLIVKEGAGINSLVPFGEERRATATETVRVETIDRFCTEHELPA